MTTSADAGPLDAAAAGHSPFRGVRVLVLGATGFIGRRVVAALTARGVEVVAVGRDRRALTSMPHRPAEAAVCDLMRPGDVAALVGRIHADVVFNVAGYGVDRSERDEAAAYRLNAELPAQLAGLLGKQLPTAWRGQVLIHLGSALEYGEATGDLREDTQALPHTLYGRSKLAGTDAITECGRRSSVRAVTARLFTVYGPGEHDGRLLPSLVETARTGNTLPLTAGTQRRDFTFVDDVVEGILRLSTAPIAPGAIINLATGRLETVRDFVETAARVLRIERALLGFGQVPTREEEMSHGPVSIQRLRDTTGWAPAITIEEGVSRAADEIRGVSHR